MRMYSEDVCYAVSSKYIIQCTPRGRTVYVYDLNGLEVAKFQDMKHTYQCLFSPDEKYFVLRSFCGMIAVYSTEEMKLIKKVHYGTDGQDGGFCFSSDGSKLFIVETMVSSEKQQYGRLVSYDTDTYAEKHIEFENTNIQLLTVSPSTNENELFLVGYKRNKDGIGVFGFIAIIRNGELTDIRYIRYTHMLDALNIGQIKYEETARCFEKLPVPGCPFKCDIGILKQLEIVDNLFTVRNVIHEYHELSSTPKELMSGEFKNIYEHEYQIVLDNLYSATVHLNKLICDLKPETPFDFVSKESLRENLTDINEKCNNLLNAFLC